MNKLLIIMVVTAMSCNSQVKTEHEHSPGVEAIEKNDQTVQLNVGNKWKADEATKNSVAAMMVVINDSNYTAGGRRNEFISQMQSRIDTLIKECRMKGADHDALHVWLKKVLKDMKEMKEEDHVYIKAYSVLRKDIESFYDSFE